MGHQVTVADEQYIFRPETKRIIIYVLIAGVVLFGLGILLASFGGGHAEAGHGDGHASAAISQELVASAQHEAAQSHDAAETHNAGAGHHDVPPLYKRIITSLWMNNVFFTGLGIIGLFFVAIQYAAQAGWSAGVIRIPLAMGQWIPIAGVLMIILFFADYLTHGAIFHWTHHDLYVKDADGFDSIINKKAPYFYWPLAGGTFPLFFVLRMLIFFGLWYMFFARIKSTMLAEDLEANNTEYWYKNRRLSTYFLLIFAVSSSISAWDWVMSIDTHWFSTMFGWYVFASWWVTGLSMIVLIVAYLKSAGYLKVVNSNHLHDLGKFVFAFSIFWTYIWFSQFMLIYYANIPEETVYFLERMDNAPYSWIFYLNLILNFVLPFLLFMTRDAKRHLSTLKVITPIVIVGHWFDFYNMVTPGIMKHEGGIGFIEIGLALTFLALYLLVVLGALSKLPLIGKNHPMLQESLHHHI
jgi:hypothetical protein